MKRTFTRRDFVVSTAKILAVGFLVPGGSLAAAQAISAQESSPDSIRKAWEGNDWGFIVDEAKCIGCARCVIACKKENSVPLDHEVYRTWVERYLEFPNEEVRIDSPQGGLEFNQLGLVAEKQFFVPKLCNQ
ncbi:MAG TPA: 4Fe-4S dicluster domain-containing protein, partial [Verrucomicrobiae bacterium]|nr:4Fe-4S dicluster domain-containing protein [Verrucomicrobiae bacterium]